MLFASVQAMCEQASAKKRKMLPDLPNSVPKSRDLRDVIVAAKARNLAKLAQDAVAANMSPIDQTVAIQSMVRATLARPLCFLQLLNCPTSLIHGISYVARSTGGGLQSVP
eukprot:COSAG02_NODE_7412_length_3027_cov_10.277664_2_plen_111_part_00